MALALIWLCARVHGCEHNRWESEVDAAMKKALKKVSNKMALPLLASAVMGVLVAAEPATAQARSSWYVSFSTGPVYVPPPCYPARVVRCRPVYYYDYVYACPPPVVYYPAPVISVGYYHGQHHRR